VTRTLAGARRKTLFVSPCILRDAPR
jgi:hypothetical protein